MEIDRKEYQHNYYLKHRKRLLIKHRAWDKEHPHKSQPTRQRLTPTPLEKKCNLCGIIKSANEFRVDKGYIKWACKECEKKYWAVYREKNREHLRKRISKYQKENREKINARVRARYAANKLKNN